MDEALEEAKERDIQSVPELRRVIKKVERAVNVNSEKRARHPRSPQRFLESEVDLDDALRLLSGISTAPELYPEFVKLGGVDLLAGMLSHDNLDIAAAVIAILSEMIEPDLMNDGRDEVHDLVQVLVEREVFQGVVKCLADRFGPELQKEEHMAKAVNQGISMFDNAIEVDPKYAGVLGHDTSILDYCLKAMRSTIEFDGNKSDTVELFAVLIQSSQENLKKAKALGAVEVILSTLGPYRKPRRNQEDRRRVASRDTDELEMVHCLFDILCSLLLEGNGDFLEAEGLELMVRFIKRRQTFRSAAAKVISFACTNSEFAVRRLFEIGGVGVLFAFFSQLGGQQSFKRKHRKEEDVDVESSLEYCLSILYEMFRFADTRSFQRLVMKFWENQGQKLGHLLQIYAEYANAIVNDASAEDQGGFSSRTFIVQLAAIIIGTLVADGPVEIRVPLQEAMEKVQVELRDLVYRIQEYAGNIAGEEGRELDRKRKEVFRLKSLVGKLQALEEFVGEPPDKQYSEVNKT